MNENWPTKKEDIVIAQQIMEEYAREQNTNALGLFELIVDAEEKKVDFRLSTWVILLAEYFESLYGAAQGEFVTRQVLSYCITKDHTIH